MENPAGSAENLAAMFPDLLQSRSLALILIAGVLASTAMARALNPICPPGVYIADPAVRQMPDGRVYLYGSRDEAPDHWCSHCYDVLSTSSDLVHWDQDQIDLCHQRRRQTDRLHAIVALCA